MFFDLSIFEKIASTNSTKAVELLISIHKKTSLYKLDIKNRKLAVQLAKGNSYISEEEIKFITAKEKLTDVLFIIQYISLAGRRDYSAILAGYYKLNLSYYPDINIHRIINNPLLIINKQEIHFKTK